MLGEAFLIKYAKELHRVTALRRLISAEQDPDGLAILESWLEHSEQWLENNRALYESLTSE